MENSLHYKLRICHTNCQKSIVIDIKSKTDLRPGEPKILEFLAEHEPCEQKVIAAGCNLDSASVTGILGRMEKRGLIKRETKNGNRRSLYVSSTEQGQQKTQLEEETNKNVDKRPLQALTKAEVKELERLLERVSQHLVALSEEQKNEERTT